MQRCCFALGCECEATLGEAHHEHAAVGVDSAATEVHRAAYRRRGGFELGGPDGRAVARPDLGDEGVVVCVLVASVEAAGIQRTNRVAQLDAGTTVREGDVANKLLDMCGRGVGMRALARSMARTRFSGILYILSQRVHRTSSISPRASAFVIHTLHVSADCDVLVIRKRRDVVEPDRRRAPM